MATNFNVKPYYDDYDSSKNFHRVLFRPAYSVQARELTQLQTILQNQITKFGNHIFCLRKLLYCVSNLLFSISIISLL